jgi:hypothetical protein
MELATTDVLERNIAAAAKMGVTTPVSASAIPMAL